MTAATFLPPELTDAQRRAIRRDLNALPDTLGRNRQERVEAGRSPGTVTDELRRFEQGDDNLFGFPRRLVDFEAVYAALGGR